VTTIDNFFIDITKIGNYSIKPEANGLSDHDAQVTTLYSLSLSPQTKKNACLEKLSIYNR
jgi:hypothetical protein